MHDKNTIDENTITVQLNEKQHQAVTTLEGPLLVLAGAGTGKTRVLTSRIANLICHNVFPSQILAVTFTNKAAKEMSTRVENIIGYRAEGVWLGTFHSIATRILRRHAESVGLTPDFSIIDPDDQIRLLKQITQDESIDDKKWPIKIIASIINSWKDKGLTPEKLKPSDNHEFADGKMVDIYKIYQSRLKKLNACDFGDLLLHNLTLFTKDSEILNTYHRQFQYILVDEYQDTNITQYLWLRLLSQGNNNICCVGDDDQSIYGWRGAEVGNIIKFEQDFENAQTIRLEQNYRSTHHILAAASALISCNQSRLGKTLWTNETEGNPIKLYALWDEHEEARYIAEEIESFQQKDHSLNEIAILVRAGFQTRIFEDCFLSKAIPYRVIGGLRFYERMEIRDVIAYLKLTAQPHNDLAFERIINTPKRGIGNATLQQIRQFALKHNISYISATKNMIKQDLLKTKIKAKLEHFLAHLEKWQENAQTTKPADLTETIIEDSGYLEMWRQDKSLDAGGRIENIKELITALQEFESLTSFLDHVSLVTDNDNITNDNLVSIMTLHSAKGLEFETVFLPGWEEGLFPHKRSLDEKGQSGLEEERRLAYVGITRAKKNLHILFAANRRIYGNWQSNIPSRFVDELPQANVEAINLKNGFNFNSNITPTVTSRQTNKPFITDNNKDAFQIGMRIFHMKFGYGAIQSIEDDKLTISFEKAGTKTVLSDYVEKP